MPEINKGIDKTAGQFAITITKNSEKVLLTVRISGKPRAVVHGRFVSGARVNQYDNHEQRCDQEPAQAPVEAQPVAQHEFHIVEEIGQAVYPEDGHHLEHADDYRHKSAAVVIDQRYEPLTALRRHQMSIYR